jgi:hypothetical protein
VAVNSIYASIIPSYKYNLVLKSFSYGTQVIGHPVQSVYKRTCIKSPVEFEYILFLPLCIILWYQIENQRLRKSINDRFLIKTVVR